MAGKLGIGELAASSLGNIGIGPLNVGNVLDTVEFVKKAWSSFAVASSLTPTIDLAELDKRIADLRAVEQWLTVNMNMLQGTIQALEIQRGTIATLKAIGAPLAAAAPAAQAVASAIGRMAAPGTATADTAPPASAPAAAAGQAARATRATPGGRASAGRGKKDAGGPAPFTDPGLSPSAWWNLLQSQFNQVAAAALSGVGLPNPPHAAAETRGSADAATRAKPRRSRRTASAASTAGAARAGKARGGTRKA